MKIELGKKYRTRDGREVRIYAVDGGALGNAIHGAVKNEGGHWVAEQWFHEGMYARAGSHMKDLIEVKPRIKRKAVVNVYPSHFSIYGKKSDADFYADKERIACVEIDIDVEEGHGL